MSTDLKVGNRDSLRARRQVTNPGNSKEPITMPDLGREDTSAQESNDRLCGDAIQDEASKYRALPSIIEALSTYDAEVASCPIFTGHSSVDVCPRCYATSNGCCGVSVRASDQFVKAVRTALAAIAKAEVG